VKTRCRRSRRKEWFDLERRAVEEGRVDADLGPNRAVERDRPSKVWVRARRKREEERESGIVDMMCA
jgi:hypothetical protein